MDIDGNGPPTPRADPTLTTAADSCCWTLPPRGRALGSDPSPSSIPLEGKRASLRQRPKPSLIDPAGVSRIGFASSPYASLVSGSSRRRGPAVYPASGMSWNDALDEGDRLFEPVYLSD